MSSSFSVLDHNKTEIIIILYPLLDQHLHYLIRLLSILPPPLHLPLVIFPDGTHMEEPSNSEPAEKIGLKTRAQMPFYDLIIIGGGPAGLAAAVYGASEGLSTLLIERQAPGGQAGMSSNIENYLGFPSGLTGSNLARRAVAQAIRFGAEILTPQEVVGLRVDGPYRIVKVKDGTEISCHALIIACGVSYRNLEGCKGNRETDWSWCILWCFYGRCPFL